MIEDKRIQYLIGQKKSIQAEDYTALQNLTRIKGKHKEKEINVKSEDGSEFIIILRLNTINALDFSVILGYFLPDSNTVFRLRRYNGKNHIHRNKIENVEFYDFHIHTATLRYQERGMVEESYAETTTSYSDLFGAIDTMVKECNIDIKGEVQAKLL